MANLRFDTRSILGTLVPNAYIDKITLESSGDVNVEKNPHIDEVASFGQRNIRTTTDELGQQFILTDEEEIEQFDENQVPGGAGSFLTVKVDVLLKDIIEDNAISSWLEQRDVLAQTPNLLSLLNVATIVSTDKDITNVILRSNNSIADMVFGGTSLKSNIISYISPRIGTTSDQILNNPAYQRLLDARAEENRPRCEENIRAESIRFRISNSNIGTRGRSEIQETSDGVRVRNFNIRFQFTDIKNINPNDLDIFVFAYIDINNFSEQLLGLDTQYRSALQFATGNAAHRSIISNGSIVRNASAFRKSDGSFWIGPVHQMPNGTWMAGASHGGGGPEIFLEKVVLPNISIQDFRNIENIEKNIQNLSLFESTAYPAFGKIFKERVKKNLTISEVSSYFSDLYLSRSKDDSATLFFSFNFDKFAKENTTYPNLLSSMPTLLAENFEILNLKIIRRRVQKPSNFKNSEIGFEVDSREIHIFDKEQVESTVIQAKQVGSSIPSLEGAIFGNSIRELRATQEIGVRCFSVKDRSIGSSTDGFYQYGVEIQVRDSLADFLNSKLAQLVQERKNLYNYFVDASRPFGSHRDPEELPRDPHVDVFRPLISSELEEEKRGNYNLYTNRFTQGFIEKIESDYATRENQKPWIRATSLMTEILLILSGESIGTGTDFNYLFARDIWTLCSPQTGTPDGIQTVIGLLDRIISRMSNMLGANHSTVTEDSTGAARRNSLDGGGSSSSSSEAKKNIHTIKYYFNNAIFDSNVMKQTGFHFLPRVGQNASDFISEGFAGTTTLTSGQFRGRHVTEVLKYFNDLNPQLSTEEVTDFELIQMLVNINPSSFSYLSTSTVMTNGQSFFLDGESSDDNIAILASNIMNLKSPPNEPKRMLSPVGRSANEWNEITTLKDRIIRDNLIDVLADKNCTIETPASPALLVEDLTMSRFQTRLQRDSESDLSGQNVNFRDYLGESSQAPSQLRENLDRIIDIHTRRDGDVFNPGVVFLKLMVNFIVDNESLFRDLPGGSLGDLSELTKIDNFNLRSEQNVLKNYRLPILGGLRRDYAGFVPSLPLQIKSLFLNSSLSGRGLVKQLVHSNQTDNFFTDKNFLKDPVKMISFYLKYMSIMEIEVLTGFEQTIQQIEIPSILGIRANIQTDEESTASRTDFHMKSPVWRLLTKELFSTFVNEGIEMFCRARPYVDPQLMIKPLKGLQLPVYDQHFIIKPSSNLVGNINVADSIVNETTSQAQERVARRVENELRNIQNDLIILERNIVGMRTEFLTTNGVVAGNTSQVRRSGTQDVIESNTPNNNQASSNVTAPRGPSGGSGY